MDAKKCTVHYGSPCYCSLYTLICVGESIMSLGMAGKNLKLARIA